MARYLSTGLALNTWAERGGREGGGWRGGGVERQKDSFAIHVPERLSPWMPSGHS